MQETQVWSLVWEDPISLEVTKPMHHNYWACTLESAAAAAKLLQSCLTLCDPTDGLLPGSPVPGMLQARTLEWAAISFSNAWKWRVKVKLLSHIQLLATPWTVAYQAPPSMGFSRQEYLSGLPLPSPRTILMFTLLISALFLTKIHWLANTLSTEPSILRANTS